MGSQQSSQPGRYQTQMPAAQAAPTPVSPRGLRSTSLSNRWQPSTQRGVGPLTLPRATAACSAAWPQPSNLELPFRLFGGLPAQWHGGQLSQPTFPACGLHSDSSALASAAWPQPSQRALRVQLSQPTCPVCGPPSYSSALASAAWPQASHFASPWHMVGHSIGPLQGNPPLTGPGRWHDLEH